MEAVLLQIDKPKEFIEEQLERIADKLSAGYSDEFRELLKFQSALHDYSWGNVWLLYHQKPEGRHFAGYRRWADLGFQVAKGSKAAAILCPVNVKEKNDQGLLVWQLKGFRTGWVFSDLDLMPSDKSIPEAFRPLPDTHEELLEKLLFQVRKTCTVVIEEIARPDAVAYYRPADHSIHIPTNRDSQQTIHFLLHEFAHSLFHKERETTLQQREFEAETSTQVVLGILGVEDNWGSDYLLRYRVTADTLRSSMNHIHKLVREMTETLCLTKPSRHSARPFPNEMITPEVQQ